MKASQRAKEERKKSSKKAFYCLGSRSPFQVKRNESMQGFVLSLHQSQTFSRVHSTDVTGQVKVFGNRVSTPSHRPYETVLENNGFSA
jgi:hypothetical protein